MMMSSFKVVAEYCDAVAKNIPHGQQFSSREYSPDYPTSRIRLTKMTLGMRIPGFNGVYIYWVQPKNGTMGLAVGVVSEPIATGFRVLVYFEK